MISTPQPLQCHFALNCQIANKNLKNFVFNSNQLYFIQDDEL